MFSSVRASWELNTLVRRWVEFRDTVERLAGSPDVTPEAEKKYLDLQAKIARLLPVLSQPWPGPVAQEAQKHQALMTDLLNRLRALRRETPLTPAEREEFANRWHQHFIFLNKVKGMRATPQPRPAAPRPAGKAAPTGMSQRQHRPWPVAWFFRFLVQLAVLVLLVYLVVRALGVRWEAGTGIAATRPASLEEVGQNLWAALGGLGQGVSGFLAPVVARYGIEVTIVLVGVLLISVGYLVFIRSR